ncbi:hypothetical protein [Pseudocolwellia sp. HL-MZ7]|uniref:hypothetical protein n=1 Tax=Pseudocolwellia sp. HL-MZ7 TaxID=3400627 RepID=UPI003CEA0418
MKLDAKWFFIPYLLNNLSSYILRRNKLPKVKSKIRKNHTKSFINTGTPFLIVGIFTIFYTKISEVMLGNLTDYRELAIFNVAITLGFAWTFVPHSLGLTFLTKALQAKKEEERLSNYSIILLLVCITSLPFILIISFFSPFIIDVLFNEEYSLAADLLPLLAISSLLSVLNVISNRIIGFYDGGGKYLYKKVFICSLVSIISSYFFITHFGIMGAAYSVVTLELISLTIGNYIFKKGMIFKLHINIFNINMLKQGFNKLTSITKKS